MNLIPLSSSVLQSGRVRNFLGWHTMFVNVEDDRKLTFSVMYRQLSSSRKYLSNSGVSM